MGRTATDPVEDAKAADLVQRLGLSETARQLGKGVPWVQRANARHLATQAAASPSSPLQPPLPGIAQPDGPLDLGQAQEAIVRRLLIAAERESRPREVGLLAGQAGKALERLQELKQGAGPAEQRGRIVFYVPQKRSA